MPPFLPRKRLRSSSPEPGPSKQNHAPDGSKEKRKSATTARKATLFDDLDAAVGTSRNPNHSKSILQKIQATDDDDSSLTSLSEDEFEDVPSAKRPQGEDESQDEDEDIEFEDVETNAEPLPSAMLPTGDLELTLTKETRISLTNPLGTKKGPSKIERGIRISTHQVHVQMLMWHNAIRNSWLCDKELQEILVGQLPETVRKEIEKWRSDSRLPTTGDVTSKSKAKGKGKMTKGKNVDIRSQRDWGEPAERLATHEVNMSRGDPLLRLMKLMITYWKQRFRITAPGLRKLGYMSLQRLDQEMKSFKEGSDPERHGERIADIKEFRAYAKALEGSRDVGAQLFTALLRGIGIEARMVASLQPAGFGWNKNEDAAEQKDKKQKEPTLEDETTDSASDSHGEEAVTMIKEKAKVVMKSGKSATTSKAPAMRSSRGNGLKDAPIDLSDTGEDAANDNDDDDDDDKSIVDITPIRPRTQPSKPYDKDLLYPHYWTEVLSPITNVYTPVDPIVLKLVASNSELLQRFEPRGAKADKAKQVTAYIIGHSSDGTAKDVTVRYLKNRMLPGRTKGNRIPVEKTPVYNSRGKIQRYDPFDWFKTVLRGYVRGTKKCPRTEIDDYEEAIDLKAAQPQKKQVKEGEETLQYYKSSTEFVLERHLRREEAILPTAKHVKMFTVKGKGDAATEEKVYLRKDVVNCKSMETWHKEGRAPLPDAVARKRVPYRAATTNRKRELAEAEHASGEKMLQGLYSREQTDWIIPPPIENGVIPKNNFGNMDVYVPSMVPEGAVHIPRRGTMKICKRLGIDYAEAVTGFEFGARMAIPIITGVVIAEEHLEVVMEEWEKDELERIRKEDEKKTKAAIGMWRKMLMGLRILERMSEEYGHEADDEVDIMNPWTNGNKGKQVDEDLGEEAAFMQQQDEDMAGGFFPEGHDEEELDHRQSTSFFPARAEDDDSDEGGGFIVEHNELELDRQTPPKSSPSAATIIPSDEEMVDAEPDIRPPVARRRGRPAGSINKSIGLSTSDDSLSKSKVATKSSSVSKHTPVKTSVKRKRQIPDSDEDEVDESSSLSDLKMEEDSEIEAPKPKKSAVKRRVTTIAKPTPSTRKMPKRNAARKSATSLRSHYFEHDDDEEDGDDE